MARPPAAPAPRRLIVAEAEPIVDLLALLLPVAQGLDVGLGLGHQQLDRAAVDGGDLFSSHRGSPRVGAERCLAPYGIRDACGNGLTGTLAGFWQRGQPRPW
jgi:hypothetical protein